MSELANTNAAAWLTKPLGDVFRINGAQVSPMASNTAEFVHYSIPAWDATGGPAIELGSQIESNKTAVSDPAVLVSKLNPRKPRVVAVPSPAERTCCSTEFICYLPKRLNEDLSFWAAYFASADFSGRLARIAVGSTNSHTRASPKETLEWLVPDVPSIEQQKIAQILDTLDTAIQETEVIIAKLKAVKQGLLHDLLTRGIDANGELRPPQSEAPHLYKPSSLGWIPKEWDFAPLVSKIDFPEGQVDPRRAPFRDWVLVAPDHIESGTGRLLSVATAAEQQAISGKYVFEAGDVIYSKIRPYLRKAVLASANGLCSADMYPLRPKARVNSRYLLAVVLSDQFSRFSEAVSMRSGFPKINRSEMAEFSVGWPCSGEQARIAEVLAEADARQVSADYEYEKLRLLKSGLMDDLLTGRVRVTPLLKN